MQEEQPIQQLEEDPRLGRTVLLVEQSKREGREVKGTLVKIERFLDGKESWSVQVGDLVATANTSFFRLIAPEETIKRMQERYDLLYAIFPSDGKGRIKTEQENREQAYLYYSLPGGRTSPLLDGLTPEEVCGLVWCDACQMAHPPEQHVKES